MSEFITIPAEIILEDVVDELSDFFVDDVVDFVKRIDIRYNDPALTKALAEYFTDKIGE